MISLYLFLCKNPNDRAPNLACCGCIILQEYDIIYNDGIRQEEHLCPPVKSFARKKRISDENKRNKRIYISSGKQRHHCLYRPCWDRWYCTCPVYII